MTQKMHEPMLINNTNIFSVVKRKFLPNSYNTYQLLEIQEYVKIEPFPDNLNSLTDDKDSDKYSDKYSDKCSDISIIHTITFNNEFLKKWILQKSTQITKKSTSIPTKLLF